MKNSKKEVEAAVVNIAKHYDIEQGYLAMISEGRNTPELVKDIAYEMFVNGFSYRACDDDMFASYVILREFADELKLNGFVEFNQLDIIDL